MSLSATRQAMQTKQLKTLLIRALNEGARTRGLRNPMEYIATLFYSDPIIAVQVLNYIMPKLKSIEAKVDMVSASRLIIQLSQSLSPSDQRALTESMEVPLLEAMQSRADTVTAEIIDEDEDEKLDSD